MPHCRGAALHAQHAPLLGPGGWDGGTPVRRTSASCRTLGEGWPWPAAHLRASIRSRRPARRCPAARQAPPGLRSPHLAGWAAAASGKTPQRRPPAAPRWRGRAAPAPPPAPARTARRWGTARARRWAAAAAGAAGGPTHPRRPPPPPPPAVQQLRLLPGAAFAAQARPGGPGRRASCRCQSLPPAPCPAPPGSLEPQAPERPQAE